MSHTVCRHWGDKEKHDHPACPIRPRKKYTLFPVTVWKKIGQVGLQKKIFFALFFWSKMCVLCMFYVDKELGGRKKL